MAYIVTTTGTFSPLVFNDLGGRTLTHPVISLDLELEYSRTELDGSAEVQAAITAGHMTVVDSLGQPITGPGTPPQATPAEMATGTETDARTLSPSLVGQHGYMPTADEKAALVGTGTPTAGDPYVNDSDARLTDARAPTPHATDHQHGGSDEVATTTPAANAIPKALGTGKLDAGWLPGESQAQTVSVAISGGDYTLISAALAAITDATSAKPYTVVVYPGVYAEASKIVCKSWVSIQGLGRPLVEFAAADHGFELASDVAINGIQAQKASHTADGFAAFCAPSGVVNAKLIDCQTLNFDIGLLSATGVTPGAGIIATNFLCLAGACTNVVKATGLGTVSGVHGALVGQNVTVDVPFLADGLCVLVLYDTLDRSSGGTSGIHALNGATIQAGGAVAGAHSYGIRLSDIATIVGSASATTSTIFDLFVEAAGTAKFSGALRHDKISLAPTTKQAIGFLSSDPTSGDDGWNVLGEFHVGNAAHPAESAFGGGDSYTLGMSVHQYDISAASGLRFTDVTTEAASATGSTFQFPVGAAIGDALVFAGPIAFPGVKINTSTLMVGGTVVWEFWDGAAWVALPVMETNANSPYLSVAGTVFTNASAQIRFGDAATWAAADNILDQIPNYGMAKFALRARITLTPTTPPVFHQVKLYPTGRTEINSDGAVEFFGIEEPTTTTFFRQGVDFRKPIINKPGDYDIKVSASMTVRGRDNLFADLGIAEVYLPFRLPAWVDTSRPLTLDLHALPDSALLGNVEFVLELFVIPKPAVFDGLNTLTSTQTKILAAPGVMDQEMLFQFKLDISTALPGSDTYLRLYRDARVANLNDTHAGGIAFRRLDLSFVRYRV